MRRLKAFGERRVGRDREFYVTICCVALVLLQHPCQTQKKQFYALNFHDIGFATS